MGKEKDNIWSEAKHLLLFFFLGFVIMAGMRMADWLIPEPPRQPLQIELAESNGQ